MKTYTFLLGLFMTVFSSCNVIGPFADEPISEQQEPMYNSVLKVNFIDTKGNSCAVGLSSTYKHDNSEYKKYNIDRDDYTLFYHFLSVSKGYPTYNFNFINDKINNYTIELRSSQEKEVAEYVRYDLQCEKIFGDDKFHTMETYYKEQSSDNEKTFYCTSFTIDGVDYAVEKGGLVNVVLKGNED